MLNVYLVVTIAMSHEISGVTLKETFDQSTEAKISRTLSSLLPKLHGKVNCSLKKAKAL